MNNIQYKSTNQDSLDKDKCLNVRNYSVYLKYFKISSEHATKYFAFTLRGSYFHLGEVILNNPDVRIKLIFARLSGPGLLTSGLW